MTIAIKNSTNSKQYKQHIKQSKVLYVIQPFGAEKKC